MEGSEGVVAVTDRLSAIRSQLADGHELGVGDGKWLVEEVDRLLARQTVHLEQIRNLSQTVPLDSEVAEALNQRGVLLAEVGTLRAERDEARGNAERFRESMYALESRVDQLRDITLHLRILADQAVTCLEANSDKAARHEWAGNIRKDLAEIAKAALEGK